MPKYFFHIYHDEPEIDQVGEEFPDRVAAWHEATLVADQTSRDLNGKFQPGEEWRLEVTDESENRLYVVHINAEHFS